MSRGPGVALLGAVLVAALLAAPAAAQDVPDELVTRVGGEDRVATAIAVSQRVFPDGTEDLDAVVLARSDVYADATVGVPLAGLLGAPLLLTPPDELPDSVLTEIQRLGVDGVVVLGSEQAVSASVRETLRGAGLQVASVEGPDRYATAAAVAAEVVAGQGPESFPGTVYVASGENFPDAISAGPLAAAQGIPILLTGRSVLPAATTEALAQIAPEEIVVLGDDAAVSTGLDDDLAAAAGIERETDEDGNPLPLRRIAGANRYETSALLYDQMVSLGFDPSTRWLATGETFADALTAGVAATLEREPLLLVFGPGPLAPDVTRARLTTATDDLTEIVVVGSTDAVSDEVETGLPILLQPELPAAALCLTVLHNNDAESQLVDAGPGLENFGGADVFAALVQRERERARQDREDCGEEGVVTLTSGDNFLAGPEFNAGQQEGAPFYDALAAALIDYDVLTLGNHDFDFGPETLARFVQQTAASDSDVTFLSANLDFSAEPELAALVDQGLIAPSTVLEVADGAFRVGVIGLTTPELRTVSSPGDVAIENDLVAVTQAQVDALREQGVQAVLLASHLQNLDEERELVAQLRGVDAVVGGGGGELLADAGTPLLPNDIGQVATSYPDAVLDADGQFVPVATTTGDFNYLGRLVLRFDGDGELVVGAPINELRSRLIRVADDQLPDGVAPDPTVTQQVVDPVSQFVDQLDDQVITQTGVALSGVREEVRTRETNLGDLIADALVDVGQDTAGEFGLDPDETYVAIQNGGGIRNDAVIPAGEDLSVGDTFDILPFGNIATVARQVDPTELETLLENAYGGLPAPEGEFAQLSGLRVTVDVSRPVGDRVTGAELADGTPLIVDGAPVEATEQNTVNVVAGDFLVFGGDGYEFPLDPPPVRLAISDQQVLARYLEEIGPVSAENYPVGGVGRITITGS